MTSGKEDLRLQKYWQRLAEKPEQYFLDNFHMPKSYVVEPEASWSLADLRLAADAMKSGLSPERDPDIIHATIWAKSITLLMMWTKLVGSLRRAGHSPEDDPLVHDYVAAINLVSLQHG